jgi:hypothetical protein
MPSEGTSPCWQPQLLARARDGDTKEDGSPGNDRCLHLETRRGLTG